MQSAFEREMAAGRGPSVAVSAACAVLLASVEAASGRTPPVAAERAGDAGTTATDAVAAYGSAPPRGDVSRRMEEGEAAELVAALTYALRFDARGKPRRGGGFDFAADLAAEWLAEHLQRSNFVFSRRRPGAPHRAG
jgi:hypothetical protein